MFSSFANTSRLVGTVFARSVTSGAAAAASASSRNFLACVPSNCTGGNDQLWSPSSRAWNIKYFAERTLSSSAAVRAKQPSRIGAAGGSVMVAGRRTGKQLAQKVRLPSKKKGKKQESRHKNFYIFLKTSQYSLSFLTFFSAFYLPNVYTPILDRTLELWGPSLLLFLFSVRYFVLYV